MEKILSVLDEPPMNTNANNQFVEDGKEILFATKAGLQSAMATTIMSFVLVTHVVFLDMDAEFKLFAGTQARKRDRELLIAMDQQIMNKGLYLAKNGYFWKKVTVDQLKKIDEYIQELWYAELNKDASWQYILELATAKYEDILFLYRNINYLYKTLHGRKWFHSLLEDVWTEYITTDSHEKNDVIEKPEQETLDLFLKRVATLVETVFLESQDELEWDSLQYIKFLNSDGSWWYGLFGSYIWQIQDEYDCAIGAKNQCDTALKQTISKSWENTQWRFQDFEKAFGAFGLALERLRGALWSKDVNAKDAANQREAALLQSFYGWDVPPERKWFVRDDSELEWANSSWKNSTPWIIADNPYLDNWLNISPVDIEFDPAIEESSVATQALIKRLEDALKNQQNPSRSEAGRTSDSLAGSRSKIPISSSQQNVQKYGSQDAKQSILSDYVFTDIDTDKRWSENIDFQWVTLWTKRELLQQAIHFAYTEQVWDIQRDRQTDSVYGNVKSVTAFFPVLSVAVYRNIELRWKKNEPSSQEQASIYNSMGKVCELQCTNLQGRCR